MPIADVMANHLRRQIRERAATTLTGLATTGSNVFQSRIYPLATAALPGLTIYTNAETVALTTMGATRTLHRDLELVVEGFAAVSTDLEDTLDQIGKEVETALAGDIGLSSLALDSYLTRVEVTFSGDGEKPAGLIRHTYAVLYRTAENAPDVAT